MTPTRSYRLHPHWLFAAALSIAACTPDDDSREHPPPSDSQQTPPLQSRPGELELVDAIDLLFVIDNSGSMASEQTRLAKELERVMTILTTGDRTPELPPEPDRSNTARYFHPAKDLHVGIVTTNVGGIEEPQQNSEALQSCRGLGDAGKLVSRIRVARDGVIAERDGEFEGYREGGVIIPPDPSCDLPPGPPYLQFLTGALDADATAKRLSCSAKVGVRGCPFEQPLEAMRLALANPGAESSTFAANDPAALAAQAANAGFLRETALLGVVLLTNEDDCSINEAGKVLFDTRLKGEAEERYGAKINLRCELYGERDGLVRSIDTYVAHLRSLKPGHPERVFVSSVVGIPIDVAPGTSLEEVLARPDMQFREDGNSGLATPSCTRTDPEDPSKIEKAMPPRRILELSKQLGAQASVHSICADGYGTALAALVDRMAPLMGE